MSPRRLLTTAGLLVIVVLVALGPQFGRAETVGSYRPVLPPPALIGDCWPLPDDVSFDFDYQVRSDQVLETDGGRVRRLGIQYDLTDAETVRTQLGRSLLAAGFQRLSGPGVEPEQWRGPGYGVVGFSVEPLPVPADSIVRGTLTLDLPPSSLTPEAREHCSDPAQSKRWPASDAPTATGSP
jgi:hypothetical protein